MKDGSFLFNWNGSGINDLKGTAFLLMVMNLNNINNRLSLPASS